MGWIDYFDNKFIVLKFDILVINKKVDLKIFEDN